MLILILTCMVANVLVFQCEYGLFGLTELMNLTNKVNWYSFTLIFIPLIYFNYPLEKGGTMDIWRNIGGTALAPLLTNPRYPQRPSASNKVLKLVSPVNVGNNYGLRLTTFYLVRYVELNTLKRNFLYRRF